MSEEGIKEAMRLVLERCKVVVEPSACVGLAALLEGGMLREELERRFPGRGDEDPVRVAVVLSGGNATVEKIAEVFGIGNSAA